MSLYNLLHGVDPATFFILPMLGEKHPDEYPRYRDCFVVDNQIHVLTRVGTPNKNCGFGEETLRTHPNYIKEYDLDQDNTYGFYVFSVPEEWKNDFDLITQGKLTEISQQYKDRLYKTYPKLTDKFDSLFK